MNKIIHYPIFLAVLCFFALVSTSTVSAANSLEEGTYEIDFTILKNNANEASMMNDYVENKARLSVRDGKKFVSITLTDHQSITGFKVEQNGSLQDAKIISENKNNNTRVVEFEVDDITKINNAWVSIYMNIPGFLYDANYDVRISLHSNTIKPITNAPTESQADVIILHLNSKAAFFNGKSFTLLEAPYTKNNRTLVPLRFISEHLGANVNWDGNTRTITVSLHNKTLSLKEGSKNVNVNGGSHTIEAAPEIKSGSTFVPLRFISEQLGAKVDWKAEERKITISK